MKCIQFTLTMDEGAICDGVFVHDKKKDLRWTWRVRSLNKKTLESQLHALTQEVLLYLRNDGISKYKHILKEIRKVLNES